jgi:hypothetical protein
VNVLIPASLLPSPWIALLRVPVTAPGQTVRVSRIGSPSCLCNAARNAAMHTLSRAGPGAAQGAVAPMNLGTVEASLGLADVRLPDDLLVFQCHAACP